MNISFESFAYKKKPPVLSIQDTDSDSSSVQCLGDGMNIDSNNLGSEKSHIILESDNDQEETIQQKSKRRRICISESGDEKNFDGSVKDSKVIAIEDSDDSQLEISDNTLDDSRQQPIHEKQQILDFVNSCSVEQLSVISGCSRGKAEKIYSLKPFNTVDIMTEKLDTIKNFNVEQFFDGCTDYIHQQSQFDELLSKCEELSKTIGEKIALLNGDADTLPIQQPACCNESMTLKNYQIIGLNWLAMLHENNLHGILADQMGLGKTIQALTFLGYLLENGDTGPHLIVCPCSTLDNWMREFEKWLPDVSYIQYTGSQNERFHMRKDILEGEYDADVIISTFNIILSTKQDRVFFKNLNVQYLILDEAHMIKNMKSGRYKHLQNIKASRKLLLTGTPLQNDVMEILSLLTFLMPDMFEGHQERIKMLFFKEDVSSSEKELVPKLKTILKPFVLRRLKKDVIQDMPEKVEKVIPIDLTSTQLSLYKSCIEEYTNPKNETESFNTGMALLTKLRKVTNHPLLLRRKYNDSKLLEMAQDYVKSPFNCDCDVDCVYADMTAMSDFELHMLCKKHLKRYKLSDDDIYECGKVKWLDSVLPELKAKGDRVLLFSQFVIVLDILEEYLKLRHHTYLRIDGSTKGSARQSLIDKYNNNEDIFLFLLSTRAGGLGINLTSANTVILHDIDFNPYNDKQAEDRCHRVGQNRAVTVYKCIGKDTIEENIFKCGEKKLLLEKELVGNDDDSIESTADTSKSVWNILKDSLSKHVESDNT